MFKKSRRRSKQKGSDSLRSHRSTGSNTTSSSVGTVRGILKRPQSFIRADQPSESSGGSRSTNTRLSALPPRKVSFTTISFREFERVIGDNPSCSSGAPIGIGWNYGKGETRSIDEYENDRLPRREQPELVLSRQEREELLVEWGSSFQEIIDAIRSNIKIKNQRRSTVNAIGRYDRWEEMMESAGRKIKRTIGLQKQYVPMVPPPTHRQEPHHHSHRNHHHPHPPPKVHPVPVPNVIPKKPMRRESGDAHLKYAVTEASRELLQSASGADIARDYEDDEGDDDRAPPSLIASSAISDNSQPEDENVLPRLRPVLCVQESGLSYDSRRPAELIELDQVEDCNRSTCSLQSGITMSETGDAYSEAGDSIESDGFGKLDRDTSYWMVGGMDAPQLMRCYNPTVINEDGSYDRVVPPAMENWQYQGFGMQPPPFSNSIVNRWT